MEQPHLSGLARAETGTLTGEPVEPVEPVEPPEEEEPVQAAAASAQEAAPDADGGELAQEQGDGKSPVSVRDELVALATDPRTLYVYWELRPMSYARALWREPAGKLVLRVLSVAPAETAPECTTRDIPVADLVGDRFVGGLLPGSEVRLCLGWIGRGFAPLIAGGELQMPRNYPAPVLAAGEADPHRAALLRVQAAGRAQSAAAPPTEAGPTGELARLAAPTPEPPARPSADALPAAPPPTLWWQEKTLAAGDATGTWWDEQVLGDDELVLFGGASDLARRRSQRSGGPPGAAPGEEHGGASEMYGGASDLAMRRRGPARAWR
jgi:hypothetical protein